MRESNLVGVWGVGGGGWEQRQRAHVNDFLTPTPPPQLPTPIPYHCAPRRVRMSRRFLCFSVLLLLFSAATAFADAPGVYAITGGTVHPVSGPEIANGVVIFRDGLIESVGANTAIPLDATIIDVKGSHIYPGLIDAQTSLGFPSATVPRRRGGGAG